MQPEIESTIVLKYIDLYSHLLWATVTFPCVISESRWLRWKSHLTIEEVGSLELWSNPLKDLAYWFTDHDSQQGVLFEIRKCLTSSVLPTYNVNFKKPQTWRSIVSPKLMENRLKIVKLDFSCLQLIMGNEMKLFTWKDKQSLTKIKNVSEIFCLKLFNVIYIYMH